MRKLIVGLLSLVAFTTAGYCQQGSQTDTTTLVKVGQTAPDFTVTMFDGNKITLSKLKGKVVVLNFWATWCPPCRAELKRVQADIVDHFAGKDFVFLPISRGEEHKTVADFREKNGYTFAMGLDPTESIFKLYAKRGIPRNFVIGKDGKIVEIEIGYSASEFDKLIKHIEKLLE